MKEAMFCKKSNGSIKCELCPRNCIIAENQTGFCRVRKNIKGKLQSLVYGKIVSLGIDPIEKKPFYMFAPGSKTLSMSTVGCNFKCDFCCNWHISQEAGIQGQEFTPEQIVQAAKDNGVQGISYTYVEPTIFYEFSLDTAKLAKKEGLYNTWVTNGYTSVEAVNEIAKYLDAVVVDFKGSANPEFYRKYSKIQKVEPIFDAVKVYKKNNVHIEITDLIVPEVGDNMKDFEKLAKWIFNNMGEMTPFHILQFFPTHRLTNITRTPVKTLERAYEIAKKAGLKYVYLGNVPDHRLENTYCHNCGELIVDRSIAGVKKIALKEGKCLNCGKDIPIKGLKWLPK